jgi:succinate dehydrogenase/fumarate reductase flavoprotein subunit
VPLPTETDVIVIGSGAAGLATACVCKAMGFDVVVMEKEPHFGGTTALSGAAIWIPLSRAAREGGSDDSRAEVLRYLHTTIGETADTAHLEAFVDNARDALEFLERHNHLNYKLRKIAPDYHCENGGATEFGRVLDVVEFDGRRLGKNFSNLRAPLRTHLVFGGMMVNRADVRSLLHFGRTRADTWRSIKLIGRYALDRVRGKRGTRLVVGSALTAQLALSVLEAGIPVLLNASASELLKDDKRVTGIKYTTQDGVAHTLTARCAVVLAAGGFAAHKGKSQSARGRPDVGHFSMASTSATADGQNLAQDVGAVMAPKAKSAFFWAPVSIRQTQQGELVQFAHLTLDRAKPGVIAVNQVGHRFTNEADSYHRFGTALQSLPEAGKTKPVAWLICDANALLKNGLGLARPFPAHRGYRKLIQDNYLIKEDSIAALADRLSIPTETLAATTERHNEFARSGIDGDFAKGASAHNVSLGDPANTPNPCLAPIAQAPFYAIGLHSGDLGTALGLKTDTKARVLNDEGDPIERLYAVGNDMNSIMGGTYPAAGITLGPALTFAYVAARNIAEKYATKKEPK